MRVAVLELAATWGEPTRVLAEVDARLAAGPPTDLVLLPEASLHGYVSAELAFDLAPFAEPLTGPTAQACAALAARHGTHLVAPLVLAEDGALYNAMVAYDPAGAPPTVYRKRHPWIPETWATPGPRPPPVFTVHGHVLTIAVCYDVHFLAADAVAELTAADVLLFPSAWVERPDHRAEHLIALARQFDLHVINANWAPGVVHMHGQGRSCVIGPDGAVLAQASRGGRIDVALPARAPK